MGTLATISLYTSTRGRGDCGLIMMGLFIVVSDCYAEFKGMTGLQRT
jgi:hypothetical protein